MTIIELNEIKDISDKTNLNELYTQFQILLKELRKRELPVTIIGAINNDIEVINASTLENGALRKLIKEKQTKIVRLLEKELKIVPQKYYRMLWLPLGMSAIGLPLGTLLGLSMENMGLLGIGLPFGMAIGIAIGSGMDKKAKVEGRQLEVVLKY